MRLQYPFFSVLLLLLIVFASGIVSADSPGPAPSGTNSTPNISALLSTAPAGQVVVYFFYNRDCGECQKAITFMEGFRERHPDVIIRSFDVANNESNQQLFQQFNTLFGVSFSPVPAVFVGEWELMEDENIELHLDDVVALVAQSPNSTAPLPSRAIPSIPSPGTLGIDQLTIPRIIVAGLVAWINPFGFFALVFLLASMISAS